MEVEPAVNRKTAENGEDSDDSMSMEDVKLDIAAARREVEESGTFEAHLKLVTTLRAAGDDFAALRAARTAFAEAYPLIPSLRLEWSEDEMAIGENAEIRRFVVDEVLLGGLRDYFSVPLVTRLLETQIERLRRKECGTDEVKTIIHQVKSRGMLAHYESGEKLWRLVMEMMKLADMDVTSSTIAQMNEVPIKLIEDVKRTEEIETVLVSCEIFEDKLADAGSDPSNESGIREDSLKSRYMSYAAYLENLNICAARCVWERCVTECFLDSNVWNNYAKFCREHLDFEEEREVLLRSVRNIPSDLNIWRELIFNIERRATKNGATKEDAARDLVKIIIDVEKYVFTSTDWNGAMRLSIAIIMCYRSLSLSKDIRSTVFGCVQYNEDGSDYWSNCSLAIAAVCIHENDFEQAVNYVSQVLNKSPRNLSCWIRGIQLMIRAGTCDEKVRELYRVGVSTLTNRNDVSVLGGAWLDFETFSNTDCSGYQQVQKLVDDRILVLPQSAAGVSKLKHKSGNKPQNLPSSNHNQQSGQTGRKRKNPPTKRRRKSVPQSTIPSNGTTIEKSEEPTQIEPQAVQYEVNTVFINNLAFKATEETVREKFADCGTIKDVRIPKRGDGAPKGMAYVEFEDEKAVESAIKLHESAILGRTIWVRRSKPPRRPNRPRVNSLTAKVRRAARPLSIEGGDTEMTEATTEPTKTQNDFRNMLMGATK